MTIGNTLRTTYLISLMFLLVGCASGPSFDASGVNRELSPQRAVNTFDSSKNQQVIWGGLIIASSNQQDKTQIEVLAYPLNHYQKPDTEKASIGRFLIDYDGYLETADYAEGRLVTTMGRLSEVLSGKIGESTYHYPLLISRDIHLWPAQHQTTEPRVHFGVGVMFGD